MKSMKRSAVEIYGTIESEIELVDGGCFPERLLLDSIRATGRVVIIGRINIHDGRIWSITLLPAEDTQFVVRPWWRRLFGR